MWFGDVDPFRKVGQFRLIVVKTNKTSYNYQGQQDNCTHIVHLDIFQLGFASPAKKPFSNSTPSLGWLEEEFNVNCEHQVNHLMHLKDNGIYEMIGDMYHWSSQSYEGEWDGDSEIRDTSIREITFDNAMYFGKGRDGLEDALVHLYPKHKANEISTYSDTYDIHPYMEKTQILRNQANVLNYLIHDNYAHRTSFRDMKVIDLENTIHMMMMEIDSSNNTVNIAHSLDIDQKTQDVLKEHENLMVEEEFDRDERLSKLKAQSETK